VPEESSLVETVEGAAALSPVLERQAEAAGPEPVLLGASEFHQLALRYERLKVVRPEAERRLLASLAEVGQQVPIVVVKQADPECIQERVRRGDMGAHRAAKYLVPLARANRQVCLELVEAIGATRLSSRDLGILVNGLSDQQLGDAPAPARSAAGFSEKLQGGPSSS
jgi:hypothetical protein